MPPVFDTPEWAKSSDSPSGKWRSIIEMLDAALHVRGTDAFGHASFDDAERKYYHQLRERIRKNRSAFWSNIHRSLPLWTAYGVGVTFFLPPEVRDRDYRSRAVLLPLRSRLRGELTRTLIGDCGRAGFMLRIHPAVFDPDDSLIPVHFHAWIMGYHFGDEHVRRLNGNRATALEYFARLGEDIPGEGGPLTRWLASRRLSPAEWSMLLIRCNDFWRDILNDARRSCYLH